MFVKFGLAMTMVGSVALLAAAPTFAATPQKQTFFGTKNAGYMCASAAASAEAKGTATADDLATCTMAIKMTQDVKKGLAESLTNRGVIHLARAEYAAAIDDSDAALQVDSKMPEAIVNRGIALMAQGRPNDAATDFTHALTLVPAHAERVFFNRALAREDMHDLKGAYLDYREAARLNPAWDKPKQELARFTVVQHTPTS